MKKIILLLAIFAFCCLRVLAENVITAAFSGIVNADNINIRNDSSANSQIICVAYKGQNIEVVLEKYDWYKIRLPKNAPAFIKKSLTSLVDTSTAKAIKEKVNIRFKPSEDSAILGKTGNNEIVTILEDRGVWYKIEPTGNTFGWIHKKFVNTAAAVNTSVTAIPQTPKDDTLILEGTIQPYGKVFKRVATHKLLTNEGKVFLIKGSKDNLNAFTNHKVKITAKPITSLNKKTPSIEIIKLEAAD